MAASGFVLLGIAHGIAMGAVGSGPENFEEGINMVMPMMAALIFIFWCSLFPMWLRLASFLPVAFFLLTYLSLKGSINLSTASLGWGFGSLQIIQLMWAFFVWKDWKATRQ